MPTTIRFLGALMLGSVLLAAPAPAQQPELPPGATACDIWAWSADEDPKGLNVRAEPSAKAPIVGVIPGPVKVRGGEAGEKERSQFRIAGYKDGWFLVSDLPENAMRSDSKKYVIKGGSGWVSARLVGLAIYAGALTAEPRDDAPITVWLSPEKNRERSDGNSIRYKRLKLLSCQGDWIEAETEHGKGWAKELCGNPLAVCN